MEEGGTDVRSSSLRRVDVTWMQDFWERMFITCGHAQVRSNELMDDCKLLEEKHIMFQNFVKLTPDGPMSRDQKDWCTLVAIKDATRVEEPEKPVEDTSRRHRSRSAGEIVLSLTPRSPRRNVSLTPSPTGEREQTGEYVDQPPPEIDGNPSVPAVPPLNLPSPQSQGGLPKTGGDMDEETRVPDIPLGSPDDTRQPEDEEVAPQPEEGNWRNHQRKLRFQRVA